MSCITITDTSTHATAEILPLGFNCFRFSVPIDGVPVETLWAAADFALGHVRPSSSGIPILFPFPGRLPGTTLEWEGKHYPLEGSDSFGNAIHGFCHTRAWRVIEQTPSKAVGQFQASVDDPSLLQRWPSDFRLTATYEVVGRSLTMQYVAENTGNDPLPCGLGVHPYFRLPLAGGAANDCVVELPVTQRWELNNMLPTGRVLEVDNAGALQCGERFEALQLDDVFAGLQFSGDKCSATLRDPQAARSVTISWDRAWRECVVYTPPHREAICIEPYTCCPGAAVLNPRGIDAGLRVLEPGEGFQAKVEIAVS